MLSFDARTGMNSPAAKSSEARPSCGCTLEEDENHPPGKKRDDVVDSSLVRVVDVAFNGPKVLSVSALSSTGVRRASSSLGGDGQCWTVPKNGDS
jgi:hypothetical protein